MITVQTDDFIVADEYYWLRTKGKSDGAIVTFTGLVRDYNSGGKVTGMFLEHYPGMTEKSLDNICQQARKNWPLGAIRIIHRIGNLKPDEQIVFVGVTSRHREAAFNGASFIMDYLKTEAPFWKQEITPEGAIWVEAKEKDKAARARW